MKYFSLFIILAFFSCKSKTQDSLVLQNSCTVIDVNKKDILISANLSDVIMIDSLVYLGFNDIESAIGELEKVIVTEDRIYVFDQFVAQKIYCFNSGGKFINSFKSIGRGPEEYLELSDFSFFEDEIFVLANPERFFVLDKDLNFNKSIEIKWSEDVPFASGHTHHFTMVNSDTILFYHPSASYHYYLYSLTKETFVSSQIERRGPMDLSSDFHLTKSFSGEVLITPRYNDTIYKLTTDFLTPKYFINLEEPVSEKEINEHIINGTPYIIPDKKYFNPNQMYDVSSFIENDSYIFFNFRFNKRIHFYFNNKEGFGTIIFPYNINNDIWGSVLSMLVGYYKNSLITVVDPQYLIDNQEQLGFTIPENLTYDSNPVLVFYKPKFE